MHLVATALALGLAGFDPLGALALVAAMALGARRRAVAVLMVSVMLTTLLVGLVPALVAGPQAWHLVRVLRHVGHRVGSAALLLVGLGLLGWGIQRIVRPGTGDEEEPKVRSVKPGAIAVTGILVGLSAFIDPAFYAGVMFAATRRNGFEATAVMVLWVLMSHCALAVLGTAALLGAYEPVHRAVEQVRRRWGAWASRALSVVLVLAGAAMSVASAYHLLHPHR